MSSEHRTMYRPDIDGLRAVSIVAVVLFHAFPSLLPGGFVGVDVFFVISGYLISGIILADLRQGGFSYLNFYFARFRRIVPSLLLMMTFVFLVGMLVLLPSEYIDIGRHLAAGASFTSNLRLLHDVGYFDTASDTKPLLHLWSLGVEEQFYIFWPLILTLLLRLRIRMLPALLALFVASFVSMEMMTPMRAFYLLPARFWELMVGGVLACVQADHISFSPIPQRHRSRAALTGAAMALVLLLIAVLGFTPASPYPGWRALLPTLAAGLLIAAGAQSWVNRHVLGNRVAVWIGVISYPLYLWHWPLLSYARILNGGQPGIWLRVALVVLAVLLAWGTRQWIELPVRNRLFASLPRRRRQQSVIAVALLCLGLVYGLGDNASHPTAWTVLRPVQDRLQGQQLGQVAYEGYVRTMPVVSTGCDAAIKEAGPNLGCWARRDHGEIGQLMWGDSHAEQFIPGLLDHMPEAAHWMIATQSGCPPALHIQINHSDQATVCAQFNRRILAFIAAHPDIEQVTLAWRGAGYLSPDAGTTIASDIYSGTPAQILQAGLVETIRSVQALGKSVVVMVDNPATPFDVSLCLHATWRAQTGTASRDCAIPRATYDESVRDYATQLQQIARQFPGLPTYDPTALFCDASTCHFSEGEHLLLRDGDHLTIYASHMVAADFLHWLAAQCPSPGALSCPGLSSSHFTKPQAASPGQ